MSHKKEQGCCVDILTKRVKGERMDPSGLAATSPKTGGEYYWVRGND